MKSVMAVAIMLLIMSAATCHGWTAFLVEKSRDSTVLKFSDGSIFEVGVGDSDISSTWRPRADCEIIPRTGRMRHGYGSYYIILNLEERDEVVARRLK